MCYPERLKESLHAYGNMVADWSRVSSLFPFARHAVVITAGQESLFLPIIMHINNDDDLSGLMIFADLLAIICIT